MIALLLLAVLVLVLLNAFFVAAEFSLVRDVAKRICFPSGYQPSTRSDAP